jgi:hypothetical protein
MCAGCGELFDLTDREKANNLKMLDDEAAYAVQAGNLESPCCLILSTQACAIDFPRTIASITLSLWRARAIPPNHSLLNHSTFQAGVGRLPGQEDVRLLFGPFRKLSRTAGV